jgi:hypothetical protein
VQTRTDFYLLNNRALREYGGRPPGPPRSFWDRGVFADRQQKNCPLDAWKGESRDSLSHRK